MMPGSAGRVRGGARVPPAAGGRAGRRPPAGLGLDPSEDGATISKPGAGRESYKITVRKIISDNDQDQPPSAVVPYSGLPVGSYDNNTAPFPNVLDSTSRRAVGTVPSPNNRFPLPSRTG